MKSASSDRRKREAELESGLLVCERSQTRPFVQQQGNQNKLSDSLIKRVIPNLTNWHYTSG